LSKNIVVLVSGGGTNLQAIIDAISEKKITNAKIELVISSSENAYALERAKKADIQTKILSRKEFENSLDFDRAIIETLKEYKADIVVLAGFMSILGKKVTDEFENKIINVHPSLIPSFCGEGFYGIKVHKAVINSGVKISGATVHFVNEIPDGGAIILQECVKVLDDDTPEVLQKRIMENVEWKILPKAIDLIANDKIEVIDNKTIIREKQNEND
jgi:phosphoribosylglycinamide formyltransferase-1